MGAHVQTDTETPSLSQSASSPSLPVVSWCSLVGCRLMDESPLSSSVKAPLYQAAAAWALTFDEIPLEASCSLSSLIQHRHEMQQKTAIGAQSPTRWGSHFGCKERILCDSCTTLSHMGGAALGWRGEIAGGQGILIKSRVLFPFFAGYIQSKKTQPRFHQSNCPHILLKLHLNEDDRPSQHFKTQKPSVTLTLSLSGSPSFISRLPPLVFTCQWLLCKRISSFSFFFVSYLHVRGSCCLMVQRWNESNLLCDSQAILLAITLIHSGQWILMTMKPGSCEEIFKLSC